MGDELAGPVRPTGARGYTAATPIAATPTDDGTPAGSTPAGSTVSYRAATAISRPGASSTADDPAASSAARPRSLSTADDPAADSTTWPRSLSTADDPAVDSTAWPRSLSTADADNTAVSLAAPSARRPGGRRYRGSQPRGRRYRGGHPPDPGPAAQQLPGAVIPSFPSLAGAHIALARMFAVSLAGCLLAAWLHIAVIAGFGFCLGCVLATRYSRRQVQLQVVLSIPVTFLAALVVAELVFPGGGSGHRTVLSVFEGTVLTLAAVAPLLFAGTAVGLGIALFRGLPQCIRELRTESHRHDRAATARRG